jgi:hypothetical protein
MSLFKKKVKSHKLPISKAPEVETVDDLLAKDDINGILQDVAKERANIQDIIVIYNTKDDVIFWHCNQDILVSKANYMLDVAKYDIMKDGDDE